MRVKVLLSGENKKDGAKLRAWGTVSEAGAAKILAILLDERRARKEKR